MAIIATGSKTIIDLSDGKSLSCYLGANQPRTQIHDVNGNTYNPNPDRHRPEQQRPDDYLEAQGRLRLRNGADHRGNRQRKHPDG